MKIDALALIGKAMFCKKMFILLPYKLMKVENYFSLFD